MQTPTEPAAAAPAPTPAAPPPPPDAERWIARDLPRIPERWNPDERATIHPRFYAGLFAIVVGVLITVVTYEGAASQGGGTYLIAYGPIVWGIINVIRGLGGR